MGKDMSIDWKWEYERLAADKAKAEADLAALRENLDERVTESFRRGVEEGRSTQAILEIQGRERFLAGLPDRLHNEGASQYETRLKKQVAKAEAHARRLEGVVRAALQLEFVALTPGPNVDNPSFQDVLTDLVLYDMSGQNPEAYGLEDYRERVDSARRDRIGWAWAKLREAINRAHVSKDDLPSATAEAKLECAGCAVLEAKLGDLYRWIQHSIDTMADPLPYREMRRQLALRVEVVRVTASEGGPLIPLCSRLGMEVQPDEDLLIMRPLRVDDAEERPPSAGRIPDGIAGVRDVDSPCDVYQPGERELGADCAGDGHYLCEECCHYDPMDDEPE